MKIRFNTKKSGQLHYGKATMVDIRDDEFEFLIDVGTVIVSKLIR